MFGGRQKKNRKNPHHPPPNDQWSTPTTCLVNSCYRVGILIRAIPEKKL